MPLTTEWDKCLHTDKSSRALLIFDKISTGWLHKDRNFSLQHSNSYNKAIIGHFRDVSPSQSLGWIWKNINRTQQKHAFTSQKKCTTTQNKHKKNRFSRLLRHPAWKRSGSILNEKRKVREKISKEKSEQKRISGEAYDISKQTIYTVSSKRPPFDF